MKKIILSLLSITGLLAIGTPATAGIISADLRVKMNLEYCCATPAGASISEVLGAVTGAGPELTVADRTINPSGWGGHIAIDINGSGTGFTLFNDDGRNVFQSAIVTISNIVSDMGDISNVMMTDNTLFTTNRGAFSTFLSYTANSITFSVLIDDMTAGSQDQWTIENTGTALFNIEFRRVNVPAPSTSLALIGLGLAGIWMRRRRHA